MASPAGPIRADALVVEPWRNGLGRKADIASGPGWTVAYAWLDGNADFSDYSGHDRTITLVEGDGFELVSPDGVVAVRVAEAFAPASFDGGAKLRCRILGGPCRVLNVMTERATANHSIEIRTGVFSTTAAGVSRLVVAVGGPATVVRPAGEIALHRFDALALTGAAEVEAQGACALATITDRVKVTIT